MRTAILIALLPAAVVALSAGVVADWNTCQTSTECTYHCHAGDTIYIQLWGPVGTIVSGETFCGNIGIYCSGPGEGGTTSTGYVCSFVVSQSGTGWCKLTQGWFASCGNTMIAY